MTCKITYILTLVTSIQIVTYILLSVAVSNAIMFYKKKMTTFMSFFLVVCIDALNAFYQKVYLTI